MVMEQLVEMVRVVNPYRSVDNIYRRLAKILEELGECSEAYLSVSSPHNYKNKTWQDYREEACDTLIVLIDVALTDVSALVRPRLDPTMIVIKSDLPRSDTMFAVAGAISAAAEHQREGRPASFYDALTDGIVAATAMCFARHDDDESSDDIAADVLSLFEKKLAKWSANMKVYQATDDGK